MKTRNISSWILAGFLIGTVAGIIARILPADLQPIVKDVVEQIKPLGGLFNRIIFMVVIPIVCCSLISSISAMGGNKIGRIGMNYYKIAIIMIIASMVVGMSMVMVFKPGEHGITKHTEAQTTIAQQVEKPVLQKLIEFVPTNPVEAMANSAQGGLIPIMVFAIFVGFALIGKPADNSVRKLNEDVLGVAIRIVDFAMLIAPFSVGVLMFSTVVSTGMEQMISLLSFVSVLIGALLIQQIVVFSIVLKAFGKSPLKFFINIKEVMATALATVSSAVTTPVAMRVAEEKMKLNPDISRLILSLGVTGAKTATSIFVIVVILFLAQSSGTELHFGQYLVILFTSFICGIVTAGIPDRKSVV